MNKGKILLTITFIIFLSIIIIFLNKHSQNDVSKLTTAQNYYYNSEYAKALEIYNSENITSIDDLENKAACHANLGKYQEALDTLDLIEKNYVKDDMNVQKTYYYF